MDLNRLSYNLNNPIPCNLFFSLGNRFLLHQALELCIKFSMGSIKLVHLFFKFRVKLATT